MVQGTQQGRGNKRRMRDNILVPAGNSGMRRVQGRVWDRAMSLSRIILSSRVHIPASSRVDEMILLPVMRVSRDRVMDGVLEELGDQ